MFEPLKPTEKVLLRHHSSEIYARRIARGLARYLYRVIDDHGGLATIRALATDEAWLKGQAKLLGVGPDHQELVAQWVRAHIEQRLGC